MDPGEIHGEQVDDTDSLGCDDGGIGLVGLGQVVVEWRAPFQTGGQCSVRGYRGGWLATTSATLAIVPAAPATCEASAQNLDTAPLPNVPISC